MSTEFEKKKVRHASGESVISTVSDYIPTPPDGGYGWVIVFASFINHIIVDGIAFTFGVFYLEFLDYFKESKGKTALVGSLLCGCYLMTGPIASGLTNRFGCRPVCVAGGLIASSAFVLSTFSPNLNFLIISYGVLGGFGFGLIYLPSVISVSYYFEKRRAMATGIAVCGAGVGCFMFAPVGRLLLETYDWKNAMLINAGVVLNSCVCGMLMRPLEAPKRKRRPRRKNVLDRLREQTILKHSESDLNEGVAVFKKEEERIERVQEVKLLRERMLRDEEGEGSLPNSTFNSNRRLDRMDSRNSRDGVPTITIPENLTNGVSPDGSITIPRSQSLPNGNATSPDLPDILLEEDGDGESSYMLPSEEPTPVTTPTSTAPINIPSARGKHHPLSPLSIIDRRMDDIEGQSSMPAKVDHAGKVTIIGNGQLKKPVNSRLNGLKTEGTPQISSAQDLRQVKAAQQKKRQKTDRSDYARPMYRKDIFYSGSIVHIPQFNSQPDMKSYLRSTTEIPVVTTPEEENCFWQCCPKSTKDILRNMLDVRVFKDPVFLIVCIGNALGMLGLYVPFVFIADRAIAIGVTQNKAAFLLSAIGITNTFGRILAGFLADLKWVNTLLLHNVALMAAGVACILDMFANTYAAMAIFCAGFGLCVATWISLTSIILCDLIGLEKLTNAFGLLTLVRGVCSVAGPPLAGMVFDATQDFNASFHVGGILMFLAGLIFLTLHLPFFTKKVKENHADEGIMCDIPDFPDDLHLFDDLDPGPGPGGDAKTPEGKTPAMDIPV